MNINEIRWCNHWNTKVTYLNINHCQLARTSIYQKYIYQLQRTHFLILEHLQNQFWQARGKRGKKKKNNKNKQKTQATNRPTTKQQHNNNKSNTPTNKKMSNYYGSENKQGTVVHGYWEKARGHNQPGKTAAGKLQKHKAWIGHCFRTQSTVDILRKYHFLNKKVLLHQHWF